MIFLLRYDRDKGQLVSITRFLDSELKNAQDARLELELELHRTSGLDEVVLLQAEREAELHVSHGRYFGNLPLKIEAQLAAGAEA